MKPVQKFAWTGLALLATLPLRAEKAEMAVQIIGRQYHEEKRTYVLPGYAVNNGNSNLNCSTDLGTTMTTTNCLGSTQATETRTPPRVGSLMVRGATFTLQLPDGRRAVVNCDGKFAERFAGRAGNRRSCRMPLVNDIRVEFSGKDAKLKWPVSLDGKKIESETYQILGVFDAPAQ